MHVVISTITMKNIAIICDSSVAFTNKEIEKYDVYIVPNLIMHNNKTYLDQIDISEEEVIELLKNKEVLTTSQANLGTIIETLESVKNKNYDYTFILSIASVLSGAHNSFNIAIDTVGLENYELVDTHSVGGPMQQGVRAIRSLNSSNSSIQDISNYLKSLFDDQVSYLFPKSLHQIVASGRLSKSSGKIVSLLRIKPVVYLNKMGKSIETLGISRTNKRAFDKIIQDFIKNDVTPDSYDLYLLDSDAIKEVSTFKDQLFAKLGDFKYYHVKLPAVLTLHAGVGAITIQWCPKIPNQI